MAIVISMSADIHEWERVAGTYAPDLAAAEWPSIKGFVIAAALDAAPSLPYKPRRVLHALTVLARACVMQGWALTRESALQREAIDYAVTDPSIALTPSSRASIRPILLRVSEALKVDHAIHRLTRLPGADPSRPYSPQELVWFRQWALGQPGAKVTDAQSMLALCAGAGLSAGEMLRARSEHVVQTPNGQDVIVPGSRPRRVPLLHEWESTMTSVMRERVGDGWLFRPGSRSHNPNYVGNFLGRSLDCGHGRPQLQRLRATWLVTHLDAGTHAVALLEAAGVESLEALTRYLQFVDRPDPLDSELALRLSPHCRRTRPTYVPRIEHGHDSFQLTRGGATA